jgi:hypothetical protein
VITLPQLGMCGVVLDRKYGMDQQVMVL